MLSRTDLREKERPPVVPPNPRKENEQNGGKPDQQEKAPADVENTF
jgi:hypothetical protein